MASDGEDRAPHKRSIPAALRQAAWVRKFGDVFSAKCPVAWCPNSITVFTFHAGHNVPESRGGPTTLDNLVPICATCNVGMGARYTIDEWSAAFAPVAPASKCSPYWPACWQPMPPMPRPPAAVGAPPAL